MGFLLQEESVWKQYEIIDKFEAVQNNFLDIIWQHAMQGSRLKAYFYPQTYRIGPIFQIFTYNYGHVKEIGVHTVIFIVSYWMYRFIINEALHEVI